MKDKGLVIGVIAVLAVAVIGVVFLAKPKAVKPAAKSAADSVPAGKAAKRAPAVPAKKPISKDMGALTVKLIGYQNKEAAVRVRAFRSIDSKTSVLAGTFSTNRMQELLPGTYDIELETAPVQIRKGVTVQKGRETVEDLGRVTGTLEIKVPSGTKRAPSYPIKIFYAKSGVFAAGGASNKPMELVAGVYDVEIGSIPRQVRKGVRIDAGKEVVFDIDKAGALIVKVVNEAGKEIRGTATLKSSEKGETITSTMANRPLGVLPGSYTVELATKPTQIRNDVKINAGEETVVEFVVPPPAAPAKKPGA